MKKLFVVLAILFIGILLAGCISQPPAPVTPAPNATPVPTTVPNVTAQPTTVATTVVPNVTKATPTPTPVPEFKITFTRFRTISPPGIIYLARGTKVVWYNDDIVMQGVIGVPASMNTLRVSSPLLPPKQSWNFTFTTPGTYDWMSSYYQVDEKGTIVIT